MASASVPSQPPMPEVTRVLDDVFTLCRIPFVHDFVFTTDPVADISMLTAPVQNEHAIAARIIVEGRENPPAFAHVFDFACDYFFCSIPAFSVGPITVGFATQESALTPSHSGVHEPPGAQRVQCSRFVRDDARGVFLMVAENPVLGITEVDCHSLNNTRKRTRVCSRFHTDALRRVLRADRAVVRPEALLSALSYLSVTYERRSCPVCKADGPEECVCTLPFKPPAHPLDFRNESCNMRLHTGLYQGGSTVRLFNATIPFITSSLSTETMIKGSMDRRVISRLNKYAVQDRMSKLRLNPFPGVTYLGENLDERTRSKDESVETQAEDGGADGAEHDNCEQRTNSVGTTEFGLPDESFLQDSHQGELKSPWLGAFGFGEMMTADPAMLFMSTDSGEGGLDIDAAPPEADMLTDAATHCLLATPEQTKVATVASTAAGSSVHDIRDVEGNAASCGTGDGKGPGDGTSDGAESSSQSNGSGTVDNRAPEANSGNLEHLEGRELKLELRKQRNRAAAAKSNIKRKIRNEKLRQDLKEVNDRAEHLRATERKLREENVELRGLATKENVQVSKHLTHIQITTKTT